MKNGEDTILALLEKYFPNSHETFCMGRGDDCALIHIPHKLLAITSDIFAQNAHFRTRYFTPYEIGYKSLAVNISDLVSNGALPRSFSLNLTLTDEEDMDWLEAFFHGMSDLANSYNMGLLGGDLAKVPTSSSTQQHLKSGLNIGITAFGDFSHEGVPLLRTHTFCKSSILNQAKQKNSFKDASLKEGDILFIIGEIGLARTGLYLLEKTTNSTEEETVRTLFPTACKAHLQPKPLVEEGLFLSQFAHKHSIFCMDISDGLKRDIPRLLGQQGIFSFDRTLNTNFSSLSKISSANIHILESALHKEVVLYCEENKRNPIDFAYAGGEDYGLLGVCNKEAWSELCHEWVKNKKLAKIQKIGEVCAQNTSAPSILLNGELVTGEGFDHFSKK